MSKLPSLLTPAELERISRECGIKLDELRRAQDAGVLEMSPEDAAEAMARWLLDPVAFVREMFGAEPDEWQKDGLRACAREPRVALKACKGPGKSTLLAWFGWWCIALHVDGNGYALSITAKNLKDNLWKELALWYARAPLLQQQFALTAERIFHREHRDTWWLSARAFAQDADKDQQANTLAGLHARFVYILADESSDYPQGVLDAAEGIFTTIDTEAHLVQAGNPTRTDGPLYRACTADRGMWFVIEITGDPDDPKRSPRISLEYARDLIRRWGRDSAVVMVNLLGKFPKTASNKLIGPDDIMFAQQRDVTEKEYGPAPVTYALDVSRDGDDSSVLTRRQGPVLFRHIDEWREMNGPELAAAVHDRITRDIEKGGKQPRAIYVDVTGVGASAFDHLELLGWKGIAVPVAFAGRADDPARFYNKRTEMWWRACEWVKARGCLPANNGRLGQELCAPTYAWRVKGEHTVMLLESKEDLAARGVASPDYADSFCMHFYAETLPADGFSNLPDTQALGGRAVTTGHHAPAGGYTAALEAARRAVTRSRPFGGR